MSESPGYTLEEYLAWQFDVVVDDSHPSFNTCAAELLGNIKPLPRLTSKQFRRVVKLFETSREEIEGVLARYNKQYCGWRQYHNGVYREEWFSKELLCKARNIITTISKGGQKPMEFDGNGWELLWLERKRYNDVKRASDATYWLLSNFDAERPGNYVLSRRGMRIALQSIHMWRTDEKHWLPVVEDYITLLQIKAAREKASRDAAFKHVFERARNTLHK